MKRFVLTVAALVLFAPLPAVWADEDDIKNHPGYIDLDDIEIPQTSESMTMIDLGPDLLKIFKKSDDEGDDVSQILSIHVRSYESDSIDIDDLEPVIERIERKLKKENWKQLIYTKEEDERTTVSLKYDEERILGLLVMSIDPSEEVTFVNIVGDFSIEDLDDFDIDLDDDTLDSLRKSVDK
jgi:hypothetical protein